MAKNKQKNFLKMLSLNLITFLLLFQLRDWIIANIPPPFKLFLGLGLFIFAYYIFD